MGLSTEDLIVLFLVLVSFLLLLFMFIFVGIAAFSTANSFSAVVNSFIPASAGGTLSSQQKEDYDKLKT